MKKIIIYLFTILLVVSDLLAVPKINFRDLTLKSEQNLFTVKIAETEAGRQNLPVLIYLPGKAFIEAKDIEGGNIVYSVITNFAHPELGGYTAFYEDVSKSFDLSKAKIRYSNGYVIDNSGEVLNFGIRTSSKVLLIPDWSYDRVMAFDFNTGDLVDTAFIHSNNPNLQSPKQALQRSRNRILVSDQISDAVHLYDTNGLHVSLFAPAGGVNNAILDNIRGMAFRPNGNLLVCNAGTGASANTIQQFDTAGNYINTFMSASVNSPFSLLYRQGDILLGNSSGTLKIFKYDFSGVLINAFTSTTLNFVQQMIKNTNGNIIACEFSGAASGLKVFDSTGTLLTTLAGVTGVRGVFRLQNGNYLTTNGTGLFEVDDTTGTMIRQIYTSSNLQYIDVFDPNLVTGIENNSTPAGYKLYNNYPNPFNPSTTIKYEIPEKTFISLIVYDNLGRTVETLQNGYQNAGAYEVVFNGKNLSSGVYYYSFSAGDILETRKMILLK
jgi:hypothetical protein